MFSPNSLHKLRINRSAAQQKANDARTKLKNLQDGRTKVLQALGPAALRVDNVIQKMREEKKFTSNVYGPIAAEIEVKADCRQYVDQLEAAIPPWLMSAYVVTNDRDRATLQKACGKQVSVMLPGSGTVPGNISDSR